MQKSQPEVAKAKLFAIVKDWGALAGNVGAWPEFPSPHIPTEFIAELTSDGKWIDASEPCAAQEEKGCRAFVKAFLSRPETYTIITASGMGTTAKTHPITGPGDCYDFEQNSVISGPFEKTAIASDLPNLFFAPHELHESTPAERSIVLAGLVAAEKGSLGASEGIQVRTFNLEGLPFWVAERHPSLHRHRGIVFAIGRIEHGKFALDRWNKNGGDDGDTVESVLGIIRLKNGREFLLTTENDPEGQRFYAYGVRDGKLVIAFKGGGASC